MTDRYGSGERLEPTFGAGSGEKTEAPANPPVPMRFTGRGSEYFGIWLSNIALTVLTLGIYSAWAAVRTRRYFYGNTSLDGHAFDYTAKPTTILKGRLIAVVAILILSAINQMIPEARGLLWLPLLAFLPWLVCRSMRFRARVTLWRNVRFHWRGTYGGVCMIYIVWPLVAVLSLGVLLPFASRAIRAYMASNLDFGSARFSAALTVGPFFRILLVALLGSLGTIVIGALILFLLSQVLLDQQAIRIGSKLVIFDKTMLLPLAFIVPIFAIPTFYAAGCRWAMINGMTLEGGHRFASNLYPSDLLTLTITNFLTIVFTLGLAYPWAKVRLWRIQAAAIVAYPGGALDSFVDTEAARGDVYSSEFAELEGFEFGL